MATYRQPSIDSPVPTLVFLDGELVVQATYHSGTGAPMTSADVGVTVDGTTLAAATTISGESITGVISLADVTAAATSWVMGGALTITVSTVEAGQTGSSSSSFTGLTAGPPTIAMTAGISTAMAFPREIAWSYADSPGFYQDRYELVVSGAPPMTDVTIGAYSTTSGLTIEGPEVAYGALSGGTLSCVLTVWSTSGASSSTSFDLAIASTATAPSVTGALEGGALVLDDTSGGAGFLLYVHDGETVEQVAGTSTSHLSFALPTGGPERLFAVALDASRLGVASEVDVSGISLMACHLDYATDAGVRRTLALAWDVDESVSQDDDHETRAYAGRRDPVSWFSHATDTLQASARLLEPCDADVMVEELRGAEGVYRNGRGIYRVVVDSVSLDADSSPSIVGKLTVRMTRVSGSPYALFYRSPVYHDPQVYPASTLYPSSTLFPVG